MSSKIFFGLFLTFVGVFAVAAQDAPEVHLGVISDKPTQEVRADEKDKKSALSPELKTKLVELLRTTGREAGSLNLSENRVRFLSDAGDLLWSHDEKTARDLFANAANDLRSLIQTLDRINQQREIGELEDESLGGLFFGVGGAGGSRQFYAINAVRQNFLLTFAKRDPQAALSFFRESERENFKQNGWNDANLETQLASIIAANDPAKALEIGQQKLAKGNFEGLDALISKLYRKDAARGAKLAAAMLKKLKTSDNLKIAYYNDPTSALFTQAADLLDDKETTSTDKPPLLSEGDVRELAEMILKARSNAVKEGAYYYDGNSEMTGYLKKYAPAAYKSFELQRKAANKNNVGSASSDDEEFDEPPASATAEGPAGVVRTTTSTVSVRSAPVGAPITTTAAGRSISAGDSAREAAQAAQTNAMTQLMAAASAPDGQISLDDVRKNLKAIRNRQQKLLALTQIVKALAAHGDKDAAKSLLTDAAEMQTAQPRKALETLQNLMLADAYSAVEPDRAFMIMESTIFEFNSVAAALGRMVEFIDVKEIADGEFNMGIIPKEALQFAGTIGLRQPLLNLANADFDRTAALADKFEKSELRMEAKMLIVRTLLPAEKDE